MAIKNYGVPPLKFTQLLCESSCVVLFPDDLTHEQKEWFWQKGVDMDDWDRMVIADADTLDEVERERNMYDHEDDVIPTRLEQANYELSRLAEGCFASTWYRVEFADGVKAVGMAYHA